MRMWVCHVHTCTFHHILWHIIDLWMADCIESSTDY
jgi:hypothetical protein